ncbi:MAG: peptidoglycan-associated lipoprotein Pal [Syntrophales bacterium]|jgi:peptidoglycan-associated lipoprotein
MRRQKIFVTLFLVAIICAFVLPAGCAKKAVMKEEPAVEKEATVEKQAPAQVAEAAPAKAPEEQKIDEAAMAAAAAAALANKEASEFADIHFAFDRFDLRPDERKILDMHAKWLKAHPEFMVRIEGNCDERGTVEYNMALGQRRAASAMKYLVDLGVEKKRLSTISYGKERPLDPGHNEDAWAKNRRDHFNVTRQK